jgi:hypothetical protein
MLLALTGCPGRPWSLQPAEERLAAGDARGAREAFDTLAKTAATPADRVAALTGAGLACDKLGDDTCVRDRLGRASEPLVPGASEPAMYHLGRFLERSDRARALNLYYRAAASAEKNRARGFPYQAAMDRILQLSMNR